jgi:hypothetical protein
MRRDARADTPGTIVRGLGHGFSANGETTIDRSGLDALGDGFDGHESRAAEAVDGHARGGDGETGGEGRYSDFVRCKGFEGIAKNDILDHFWFDLRFSEDTLE